MRTRLRELCSVTAAWRMLALLSLVCHPARAGAQVLELGRFSLRWEDGWTLVQGADPIRYQGPGPTYLTVDLVDHEKLDAARERQSRAKWLQYATGEVPRIARRHGSIVAPLREERLPGGYLLYSIAGVSKRGGREYSVILFVSVSPEGRAAQLALEGFGRPLELLARFHPLVASGRWRIAAER